MREYDVDSGMSLYKLREYMDRELGFSPDQMTVFDTLSAAGKFSRRIGLFDFGDGSMDMITIDNTVSHEETVLRYVYNLTQNLCIELRLEGEQEFNRRLSYPVLVAEKGRNPEPPCLTVRRSRRGGLLRGRRAARGRGERIAAPHERKEADTGTRAYGCGQDRLCHTAGPEVLFSRDILRFPPDIQGDAYRHGPSVGGAAAAGAALLHLQSLGIGLLLSRSL